MNETIKAFESWYVLAVMLIFAFTEFKLKKYLKRLARNVGSAERKCKNVKNHIKN